MTDQQPSEWRCHKEPVRDPRHALELLDDVDSLVRFCAAYMPDPERYYRGGEAMWRVAEWIASMTDSLAPVDDPQAAEKQQNKP